MTEECLYGGKVVVLDILFLSDIHYTSSAEDVSAIPSRRSDLGAVLLEKSLHRLQHEGINVDLIILAGDIINDGEGDYAESNLEYIADIVKKTGIDFLAVAGNHDGSQKRFIKCFGCEPGLHQIGGYGFVLFNDDVGEGDVTTRADENVAVIAEYAEKNPELPLIAIQHNPLHPDVESKYPFMLTNRQDVINKYIDSGVILSISGHYHDGQAAHKINNTTFYTVPAICEDPFKFAHIKLTGREVVITEKSLKMDVPGLTDTHCHTELAYCGTTVNAEMNIELARALGIARQYFTEHAFHLYFDKDTAWSFKWQTDDKLVEKVWSKSSSRMKEFRQLAAGIRNDFVRIGLEVDLRGDGSLLLADEDKDGWDILVGAVHSIPGCDTAKLTEPEIEKMFLQQTERLLSHPIHVLAHPFRFFKRIGNGRPVHLYKTVAEMLAASGVAAEINFHTNNPDPRFVEECLACGVKIALGSDSHALWEVGEFMPHLMVLRSVGVRDCDLPNVLMYYAS